MSNNAVEAFYDNSILLGTKTIISANALNARFYDNSILLGTKTLSMNYDRIIVFYDNSILLGTKTGAGAEQGAGHVLR